MKVRALITHAPCRITSAIVSYASMTYGMLRGENLSHEAQVSRDTSVSGDNRRSVPISQDGRGDSLGCQSAIQCGARDVEAPGSGANVPAVDPALLQYVVG